MKKILAIALGLVVVLGSCLIFTGCEDEYNMSNIAYIDVKYNGESLPGREKDRTVIYHRYDGNSPALTPIFMYKDKPRQERIGLAIFKREWDSYSNHEDLLYLGDENMSPPMAKGCYLWKYYQIDDYPDMFMQTRRIIVWIYSPEDMDLVGLKDAHGKTEYKDGDTIDYEYTGQRQAPWGELKLYGISEILNAPIKNEYFKIDGTKLSDKPFERGSYYIIKNYEGYIDGVLLMSPKQIKLNFNIV